MAQGSPMPGEKYLHFKNRMYQVIAVAYYSETMEKQVVYQALYGDFKVYVRPYDMFISEVDHEKYPTVKQKYRFQYMAGTNDESWVTIDHPDKVMNDESDSKKLQEADGQPSGSEEATEPETVYSSEKAVRVLKTENVKDGLSAVTMGESDDEEERLNPWLERFLDAENFDQKYKIVCDMQREVTDRLIDDIAVVMDLAIPEGDVKERYDQLKYCMRTRQRYEQGRLR